MSVIGSAPAVCLLHLTLVVGKPNQSSYCHLVVAVSCLMKLKKKKHFCCWLRGIITTGIKTRTRILSVQITMEARRGGVDSIHVKTCCCCWCAQQITLSQFLLCVLYLRSSVSCDSIWQKRNPRSAAFCQQLSSRQTGCTGDGSDYTQYSPAACQEHHAAGCCAQGKTYRASLIPLFLWYLLANI